MFGSIVNRLSNNKRALSKYSVGAQEPGLAFDFVDNVYQKDQNKTVNFDGAITHSRSGNAVMTDGYGPELVSFDSASNWTLTGSATISDGKLVFTDGATGTATFSLSATQGKQYVASIRKLVEGVSGAANVTLKFKSGGSNVGSVFSLGGVNGPKTFEEIASPTSDADAIEIQYNGSGSYEYAFDNVSVREMPVLKWAPHNLLTYSEDFSNAAWVISDGGGDAVSAVASSHVAPDGTATAYEILGLDSAADRIDQFTSIPAVDGATYTYAVWLRGSGSINTSILDSGGSGQVEKTFALTDEWVKREVSITFSNPTGNIRVHGVITRATGTAPEVHIWGAHLYRSDLGGMAGNPDQPPSRASYVPTTSSAVYLPRVGHHVYNGSAWVNEGLLAESEARTNLLTYSNDFTNSAWTAGSNVGTLSLDSVGPDGQSNSAVKLVDDGAGGSGYVYLTTAASVDASSTYTWSLYAKKDQLDEVLLYTSGFTTPSNNGYVFNLTNGTVSAFSGTPPHMPTIQDVGNGWYRCAVTFTTDSVDTGGSLQIYVTDSGSSSVSRDGTSSILIYGSQFEKGSTPSSFVPTSGSGVTRASESFTIPSANLPWPEPSYIGSELVTNGTFDTDSDWTKFGTITIASGEATLDSSGATLVQAITTVVGDVYNIDVNVSAGASAASVRAGTTQGGSENLQSATITTSGIYSFQFVATATTTHISLVNGAASTTDFTADSISVREVNPLSVSIAMDGRMTYADEGGNTATFSRWREDSDNYINHFLYTTGSETGEINIFQRALGTTTQTTSASQYQPDILVPYNIATRHGSNFVNLAKDGLSETAVTTPTALPNLSATDLDLAYDYMGTIGTFRVWDRDLGDDGIVEATNPSLEPSLSLTFEGTGTNSFVVNNWSE